MSLVVDVYTSRSSKPVGRKARQRQALAQFSSQQERVMALDPVSGHHL
jgi:hypothetical protein